MIGRLLISLVIACAAGLPVRAVDAQPVEGRYLAFRPIFSVSAVDGVTQNTGAPTELRHDEDLVGALEFAIGYGWARHGLPVRTEITYQHRMRFDFDYRILTPSPVGFKNQLRTDSLLVTAVYDVALGAGIVGYAGGGIGWTRNWSEVDRVLLSGGTKEERTDAKDNFSWQLQVGATYRMSDYWTLEIGYRYADLGAVSSGPFSSGTVVEADSYTSHDFFAGLIFSF